MTEYKNIRVSVEAWEKAKDAQHDDENWSEYILRCADTDAVTSEADVRGIVATMVDDVCLVEEYRDLEPEDER